MNAPAGRHPARWIIGMSCATTLLVSSCSTSTPASTPPTASSPTTAAARGDATLTGRLLFSRFDESSHSFKGTYVAGADGRHETQVPMPGPEGGGRWSHSGDRIAVMTQLPDNRIGTAIITADGTVVRTLKLPDRTLNLVCTAWAPDDKRLGCEGFDDTDDSRAGIYTVRASDGGGVVRLTTAPYGQGDLVGDYSPDGKTFLFKRAADEMAGPLMVVPVAGGPAKSLTSTGVEDPGRYSPDGRSILTSSAGVIRVLDASGRETSSIEQPGKYAFGPVWSPDGQHVAFSVTVGDSFHADIFTARPDGSDLHQVTATPDNEIRVEWGRS